MFNEIITNENHNSLGCFCSVSNPNGKNNFSSIKCLKWDGEIG